MIKLSGTCCKIWMVMLCPFFSQAQNSLSGTVMNSENHQGISGAIVRIENSFLATETDSSGQFEFTGLTQTDLLLNISHLSFGLQQVHVLLPSAPVEINMVPRLITAEEVTVTALRADEHSGFAYSSVSKDELESKNLGQDIPYLLSITPSAVATSDAGNAIGYTGMRIRGSDATRVNVTLNGIPVNDAESQAVYWVDLPDLAASVDNIQIQRGIGTSTNGAGAFGASVNIQSTKISDLPYGTFSSSAGSYQTTKNSFSFGTGMMNKFSFDGRFSIVKSDGFIDRASSDLKSLSLSGGLVDSKSSLRFILFTGTEKTYQAWYGVPEAKLNADAPALLNHYYNNLGVLYFTPEDSVNLFTSDSRSYNYYTYENQTDNYKQDYYQLHYSIMLSPNWNANAALHYTRGRGYYEEFRHNENLADYGVGPEIIGSDTILSCDLVRQRWLDNDFYGAVYSLQFKKNKLGFIFGGGWNRYSGDHYGEITWAQVSVSFPKDYEYNRNTADKYDFNSYAKAWYEVNDKMDLFADIQYRTIDYSFFGYDATLHQGQQNVTLDFLNPKAGIRYVLSARQSLYASAGMGHKEPSRDDYTDAPANNRPGPESMIDLEAGYKINQDKFQAGINLFDMIYDDQLVVTGFINDAGLYPRQNVPDSYRRGVELEAGFKLAPSFTLAFNATLSENKIGEYNEYIAAYDSLYQYAGQEINHFKNTDLAFSPRVTGSGMITWMPAKNLSLNMIGKYVGKQYLDNTQSESRKLSPYFVSDVRINYSLAKFIGRRMDFMFAVYNLFDQEYESNGYTYSYSVAGNLNTENYYYPQAGTHFLAGITLRF